MSTRAINYLRNVCTTAVAAGDAAVAVPRACVHNARIWPIQRYKAPHLWAEAIFKLNLELNRQTARAAGLPAPLYMYASQP